MSDAQLSRTPGATYEALWPKDLFTAGIGWVIVARFKSGGRRVEAGIFLVDVLCLGVNSLSHPGHWWKKARHL